MVAQSSKSVLMLLMFVCLAICSPTGLARLAPESAYIPSPNPLLQQKDVLQCWSSLIHVEGCVVEILTAFATGRFGVIGHECCKAITAITDNCWPKLIIPFNPLFPPLLKSHCASNSGVALAPKQKRI